MCMFDTYRVTADDDWSAVILIRVFPDEIMDRYPEAVPDTERPSGYVFEIDRSIEKELDARDPPRFRKAFWKMPAEHRDHPEDPLQTAVRGVHGETGLVLDSARFSWVVTIQLRGHKSVFFTADMAESELSGINPYDPENEGEEAKFFSVNEFWQLVHERNFLSPHFNNMEANRLLVLPSSEAP